MVATHNGISGVPQGSVLSPLLFILYVNDITDGIQSTLEIFCDDSKLYRIIQNPCDTETLQQDLNYVSNWSKLWLLNFTTIKCSVMQMLQCMLYVRLAHQISYLSNYLN